MQKIEGLLDSLITLGSYNYEFDVAGLKVVFNMADVGSTSSATVSLGVQTENDLKAAKMASCLLSANRHTFQSDDPLLAKYRFLRSLKEPMFDYFWDNYQITVTRQHDLFQRIHIEGKKSLLIQDSEPSGESSSSQE